MKFKRLTIALGLVVLIAIGCSKNNDIKINPNDNQEYSYNKNEVNDLVSYLKLEGDIKNIYYAHKNKVLISADKLFLYDIDTEKVLKESPLETSDSEKFWVIDSGYVAVREFFSSASSESIMVGSEFSYKAVFYDHDLNIVSEFDLNQLFDRNDMLISIHGISFSSTGTQVAYATYSGLYIYDFDKSTKTTVIDLASADAEERSGIVIIEQIGFTNDDKCIAFKAQSFDIPADPQKPSFDTFGIVNSDGTGLLNKTFDNYICKKLAAYNHLLLLTEDPTNATGKTMVIKMPSNKIKIYSLKEEAESGNVWGSNRGSYFATSMSDKTGWIIRIYNTETGILEGEQHISSDGEERYMSHDPIIRVIDDTRSCIVLLGAVRDDIETKMIVSQF